MRILRGLCALSVLVLAGAYGTACSGDEPAASPPPGGDGDASTTPDVATGVEDAGAPGDASDGAAPPSVQYAFISATGDSTLRVYDLTDSLPARKTIPVCSAPAEVRARRDGKRVAVVCPGTDLGAGGQVALVDTSTLSVAHTVDVGIKPTHAYVAPDGKALYVCDDGDSQALPSGISIIDTDTGMAKRVATGLGHHKLALATDGQGGALRFTYVSNIADGTVTVVDPQGNVVKQIPVGPGPHGMDYSWKSKRVYNCSGAKSDDGTAYYVEVIATEGDDAHTVVDRVPLEGARCGHLEVSPDGAYAWASMSTANKIARIDTADGSVSYYDAGEGPDWFAFLEGQVWIADSKAWTLTVVPMGGGPSMTIDTPPPAGADAGFSKHNRGLAFSAPWLFVTNRTTDSVDVVRADHGHVHLTLTGIPGPNTVAVAGPKGGTPFPR